MKLTGPPTAQPPGLLRVAHGGVWSDLHIQFCDLLDRALGESDLGLTNLTPTQADRVLQEADQLTVRIAALKLRVVAAVAADRAHERTGDSSTGALVARATQGSGAAAAKDARLAESLTSGQCDATRTRLEAGSISPDKASIVARALDDLPAHVDAAGRATVEEHLLRQAETTTPGRLRHAAKRALEAIEPDPVVVDAHENDLLDSQEERALAACRFAIHDNHDGTMSGSFTVPALAGAVLKKVLEGMSAPRRRGGSIAGSVGGHESGFAGGSLADDDGCAVHPMGVRAARSAPGPSHLLTPEERRQRALERMREQGRAFGELLLHLPTDHLPTRNAATVVVSMTLASLRGQLAQAGVTEAGTRVSAGEARRLACGAGLVPQVLGGESVPLDLGRQRRLFSDAQRTALATVHDECAADGCDRPFAWTELHHITPWQQGGRSDLANAVPLCGFHHREVHRPGREVSFSKQGSSPRVTVHIRCRT